MISAPSCVIMAAGEGARMRPLTENRPKVMLPVAGRPILEHLILQARAAGITDFILVVGYQEQKVRGHFNDGSSLNVSIRYSYQSRAGGTADALRQAIPQLSGPFLLLNGDIMMGAADIARLSRASQPAMSLVEMEDVSGMGVVETIGGTRVSRLHEKSKNPPTRLANAGAYYFTPSLTGFVSRTPRSPRGEYEITDTIQLYINEGGEVSFQMLDRWRDIGRPWDLLEVNEQLLADIEPGIDGQVEAGAVLKGAVRLGSRSVIRAGVYIEGPVMIGDDCLIGPNCYLRPGTVIGNGCHIGAGVEIKNSIIMNGTKIPHLTYLGDSVVGENCNFGAGTQVANLRFDGEAVTVSGVNTRRRKLGAIIGDDVSTGVNASISPGTVIGSGARIGAGRVVSGRINAGARIY